MCRVGVPGGGNGYFHIPMAAVFTLLVYIVFLKVGSMLHCTPTCEDFALHMHCARYDLDSCFAL